MKTVNRRTNGTTNPHDERLCNDVNTMHMLGMWHRQARPCASAYDETIQQHTRPIALASCLCKVPAATLATRSHISSHMHGAPFVVCFRAARSTAQPVFVVRRAQYQAYMQGTELRAAFLAQGEGIRSTQRIRSSFGPRARRGSDAGHDKRRPPNGDCGAIRPAPG